MNSEQNDDSCPFTSKVEQCQYSWGIHDQKPRKQAIWESQVAEAAEKVADLSPYMQIPQETT